MVGLVVVGRERWQHGGRLHGVAEETFAGIGEAGVEARGVGRSVAAREDELKLSGERFVVGLLDGGVGVDD